VARQLAQAASEANRLSSAEQTPSSAAIAGSADAAPPPFSFLSEAAEEQLSALLGGERPQTIAVVFSQLPPERAGTVLGRLPPLLQVEVVRRLAELDSSDPETLREIEQTLLARLSRQFAIERKHTAGPETIAKILAACDTRLSAKILTNLAQHDRPLAERLVARPLCSENYPPRTTRAA
jgi:flagellar motor switch protein FliG